MEDTIQQELEPQASYRVIDLYTKDLSERYLPLIYSRWLKSLRYGNKLFERVDSDAYFKHYHDYIEKILAKPDCLVKLAVLADDDDNVLGFSVSRQDVLDYVHVHINNRHVGIGTNLIPEGITTFTHITLPAIEIWTTKPQYKHWKFNPFA